ncbi:hypothetical protein BLNAU_7437 [Blattamonas nauphoetae]|uniref:Uncharacterized protein n=1 Tax=Blattamonas nauphoetae TaxID=2049346 RepID=A0ABQ9Y1C0_9EUKA|nr:hypothetical protein BLNAU_7437 [Blattamonas nauphoetae]
MGRTTPDEMERELLLLSSYSSSLEIMNSHTRCVLFSLPLLSHSPHPLSSSAPSTLPSLRPPWLSTRSLHALISRGLSSSGVRHEEALGLTLTRPNIVPILFLRSLRRIVRRSRCALTCRSACPCWTCCG